MRPHNMQAHVDKKAAQQMLMAAHGRSVGNPIYRSSGSSRRNRRNKRGQATVGARVIDAHVRQGLVLNSSLPIAGLPFTGGVYILGVVPWKLPYFKQFSELYESYRTLETTMKVQIMTTDNSSIWQVTVAPMVVQSYSDKKQIYPSTVGEVMAMSGSRSGLVTGLNGRGVYIETFSASFRNLGYVETQFQDGDPENPPQWLTLLVAIFPVSGTPPGTDLYFNLEQRVETDFLKFRPLDNTFTTVNPIRPVSLLSRDPSSDDEFVELDSGVARAGGTRPGTSAQPRRSLRK